VRCPPGLENASLQIRDYRSPCIICCMRRAREHKRSLSQQASPTLRYSAGGDRVSGRQQALERNRTALAPADTPAVVRTCGGPKSRRSRTLWHPLLCSMLRRAEGQSLAIPSAACLGLSLAAGGSGAWHSELMLSRSGPTHFGSLHRAGKPETGSIPAASRMHAIWSINLSQTAILQVEALGSGLPSESPGYDCLPIWRMPPAGRRPHLADADRVYRASRLRLLPEQSSAGHTAFSLLQPRKKTLSSKPKPVIA